MKHNRFQYRCKQIISDNKSELIKVFYFIILIILFYILNYIYYYRLPLDENLYNQEYLVLELLSRPSFSILFVVSNGFLIFNYKIIGWKNNKDDKVLKYFIFIVSIIIAWSFSTYDYNFYFDQPHYLELILLIVLSILILYNPVFIGLFLVFAIVVVSQFEYPKIFYYTWTDKIPLFKILVLFNGYLYLRLFNIGNIQLIVLLICILSCNYFYSGWEKIQFDWFSKNQLEYLVVSSYLNGWMSILEKTTVLEIANIVKLLNVPLIIATLIIELVSLFILFKRNISLLIIINFIFLHFFIFIFSGIFFWKWMLLNLAVVFLIMGSSKDRINLIFTRSNFVISVFLILFSPLYLIPMKLGWIDSKYNNFYDLQLVGESGTIYEVNRNFMSPYDVIFAQSRFYYLDRDVKLVNTYGSCLNVNICNKLESIDDINTHNITINSLKGKKYYNPKKIVEFRSFIRKYFTNLNNRKSRDVLFNRISAPFHINNFNVGDRYEWNENIKLVKIIYTKTFFDGKTIHYLNRDEVQRIYIMNGQN